PMTSRQAQAGGYSPRPQRPAKEESPSAKSSRNALDELMSRPESTDYRIIIHRYLPTYTDNGVKVPTGRVHETIVMPYDSLVDEVSRAWGGTSY
ncbi:hypothetical protein LRR18_18530, partial [Mangrovimonas sp. AS39]|uniref:hypothetical protein n=1 Tax=Mangrovimonas futianensis TaxID=2895523 RepID=UPI001E38B31A